MRLFIWLGLLIFSILNTANALIPSKLSDGEISFAIASVDGTPMYLQSDIDNALLNNPTAEVVNYTPSFYELAISTTIGKFQSYDDFTSLMTSKAYIGERVIELDKTLMAYEDLKVRYPSFTTLLNNKIKKVTAQIDLLVSLFISL